MTDQWDRISEAIQRTQNALGWKQNLEVYVPSTSPNPGHGYSVNYPSSPTATLDAEITTPEAEGDRDAGGTFAEADVVIRVRDDTSVSWYEYGAEDEAAIEVVDTETSVRYAVETVVGEHNGLLALGAVEV